MKTNQYNPAISVEQVRSFALEACSNCGASIECGDGWIFYQETVFEELPEERRTLFGFLEKTQDFAQYLLAEDGPARRELGFVQSDLARQAAIEHGIASLAYARYVEGPHDATRAAAISGGFAYDYALYVDQRSRDDTRAAAINEGRAYAYAYKVDKRPRDDTRTAAIADGQSYDYAMCVDRIPPDDVYAYAGEYARLYRA